MLNPDLLINIFTNFCDLNNFQIKPKREKHGTKLVISDYQSVVYERKIDAIDYMKTAFLNFHDFVERVSKILGFKSKIIDPPLEFVNGEVVRGEERTLALMFMPIGELIGHEIFHTKDGRIVFNPLKHNQSGNSNIAV